MLEKSVEKFLYSEVKRVHGRCIKLNPAWNIGIPDRLVLLNSDALFVELKRPKGGKFSVMQLRWKKWLTANGFYWYYANTKDLVRDIIQLHSRI